MKTTCIIAIAAILSASLAGLYVIEASNDKAHAVTDAPPRTFIDGSSLP